MPLAISHRDTKAAPEMGEERPRTHPPPSRTGPHPAPADFQLGPRAPLTSPRPHGHEWAGVTRPLPPCPGPTPKPASRRGGAEPALGGDPAPPPAAARGRHSPLPRAAVSPDPNGCRPARCHVARRAGIPIGCRPSGLLPSHVQNGRAPFSSPPPAPPRGAAPERCPSQERPCLRLDSTRPTGTRGVSELLLAVLVITAAEMPLLRVGKV